MERNYQGAIFGAGNAVCQSGPVDINKLDHSSWSVTRIRMTGAPEYEEDQN